MSNSQPDQQADTSTSELQQTSRQQKQTECAGNCSELDVESVAQQNQTVGEELFNGGSTMKQSPGHESFTRLLLVSVLTPVAISGSALLLFALYGTASMETISQSVLKSVESSVLSATDSYRQEVDWRLDTSLSAVKVAMYQFEKQRLDLASQMQRKFDTVNHQIKMLRQLLDQAYIADLDINDLAARAQVQHKQLLEVLQPIEANLSRLSTLKSQMESQQQQQSKSVTAFSKLLIKASPLEKELIRKQSSFDAHSTHLNHYYKKMCAKLSFARVIGKSCFYLINGLKSWREALYSCHTQFGHLALVANPVPAELVSLMNLHARPNYSSYWIGFHMVFNAAYDNNNNCATGCWIWEENATNSEEDSSKDTVCGSITEGHSLALEEKCTLKKPFICMISYS